MRAAGRLGVSNFVYPSIVGIDRKPIGGYPYYKAKLETEELIESAGGPWTILRATQFHTLALRMLDEAGRLPWQTMLKDAHFQLLDAGEAADHVAAAVEAPAAGRPARHRRAPRRVDGDHRPRLPAAQGQPQAAAQDAGQLRGFGKGFVAGQNLAPAERQVGKVTWEDFLSRR